MATGDDILEDLGNCGKEIDLADAQELALQAYLERRAELPETLSALLVVREAHDPPLDMEWLAYIFEDASTDYELEHARLVDLIDAITRMKPEDLDVSEAQKERHFEWREWLNTDLMYRTLCEMQDYIRDDIYFPEQRTSGQHIGVEKTLKHWAASNSFFAHLYLILSCPLGLEWAMIHLRNALDGDIPPTDVANEHSAASQYDIRIQGLAPFLLINGKQIDSLCGQRDAFPACLPLDQEQTHLTFSNTPVLYHGSPGWSIEQWSFWKNRLQEIRDSKPVRQDTKEIINRTVDRMEQVEKEN